jgi:predicted O-methyltransferase YrrM
MAGMTARVRSRAGVVAIALIAGAAVAAGLLVLEPATRSDVLQIMGPAVVAAALVLLVLQAELRRRAELRTTRTTTEALEALARTQARHGALLKTLQHDTSSVLVPRSDAMKRTVGDLQKALDSGLVRGKDLAVVEQRLLRAGRADTRQVEAYLQLLALAAPTGPIPGTRGWAASPDHLLLLCHEVRRTRPRLVLDLGSGQTTLWMALVMAGQEQPGRIVSIDHDPEFLASTGRMLAEHGVDHLVDLRLAALTPWSADDGTTQPWYDDAAFDDLHGIDLVSIDGPPESTAPMARRPALPALGDRLSPTVTVVLDDADRDDERAAVEQWIAADPDLVAESIATEKGTVVLRRTPGASGRASG